MDNMTLKIPAAIKEKLINYSTRKGVSKSEVVREALVEYFEKEKLEKQGTFYDLAKDLAGSIKSSPDLSINKKHLSGYGK